MAKEWTMTNEQKDAVAECLYELLALPVITSDADSEFYSKPIRLEFYTMQGKAELELTEEQVHSLLEQALGHVAAIDIKLKEMLAKAFGLWG